VRRLRKRHGTGAAEVHDRRDVVDNEAELVVAPAADWLSWLDVAVELERLAVRVRETLAGALQRRGGRVVVRRSA